MRGQLNSKAFLVREILMLSLQCAMDETPGACVWASKQTSLFLSRYGSTYLRAWRTKPNDCDDTICSASLACVQESSSDPIRRMVPGPLFGPDDRLKFR